MARATEFASAATLGRFPENLTTTVAQVDLLREDNVVSAEAISQGRTLQGLGLEPRGVEAILPLYITRFRKTGQFENNRFA